MFDGSDHVFVAVDLHQWWVVFGCEGYWRNAFDLCPVKLLRGRAWFVADELPIGRMVVPNGAQ